MIGNFELIRTHSAHLGSSEIVSSITGQALNKDNNVEGKKKANSTFQNYLLDAVDYVNGKQHATSEVTQKLITDPDSVDVHDVTTAMAEANLSLNFAQNVIDRLLKGWTEITTTR